ncbi:MAG: hypothetical protein Q9220_003601 [cf. Caloplaca sp. 1 TL-2023]
MRLPSLLSIVYTLLLPRQGWAHFSLTELQPISGFSEACTQAYETPLSACTVADFYQGTSCSPQCVAFLEGMTRLINAECNGLTAYPSTLIGMFFQKTAVEKLCANTEVTTVSAGGAGQGSTPSSMTAGLSSQTTSASLSSSPTRTTATSSFNVVVKTTTTSSSSKQLTTSSSQTTSTVASSTTSSGLTFGGGSVVTPVQTGQVTASPSDSGTGQSSPTQSSQNAGGGGGSGGNNNGNGGTVLDAARTGHGCALGFSRIFYAMVCLGAVFWIF